MNEDSRNISFLGKGWSFPPRFNGETREVEMRTGAEDIVESLRILLGTGEGERFLNPTYGLDLHALLFEPLTTTMATLLKDRIKMSILIFEPRIRLLDV